MADFRSELLKVLPSWSPMLYKYLDLDKESFKVKPKTQEEKDEQEKQRKKWVEQALKEHNSLMRNLKVHDKHMLVLLNKFSKDHPDIPEANLDELREKIKNRTVVKRAEFYADKGDGALRAIKGAENTAVQVELDAILKEHALFKTYKEKVAEWEAVLTKAQDAFERAGPKYALSLMANMAKKFSTKDK
ncbi:MAG: hypothetical protein LBR79_03890 [Oscillospiraceae bacterium]|jgi:hypothetical protein|nr:hypothetical protein [Oscillospiraceae bacterium]